MTLYCNCDMPAEIYADWLQDQGWECDELRSEEELVLHWCWYWDSNGGYPRPKTSYGDAEIELDYTYYIGVSWPADRNEGSGDSDYRGDAC